MSRHTIRRAEIAFIAFLFGLVVGGWIVIALAVTTTAHAAPPPGSDGRYAEWFQSLESSNGIPCCSEADCRRVAYRIADDHYEAFIGQKTFGRDAPDAWLPVPKTAVLHKHDNPTGEAIACYFMGQILCFVEASGT